MEELEAEMYKAIVTAIVNEAAVELGPDTKIHNGLCEIHKQRGMNGPELLAYAFGIRASDIKLTSGEGK
jgi:hypothetical protein